MSITVHDVAARAGVSPSTVSRVINKNHDISPATMAVVEGAMLQLGYRRSATRRGRRPTRRSLHANRTQSLALLIPDEHIEAVQTPLTGQLVHGVEAVARAGNFNFLLTRLAEDGGLPPCLTPVQADGLIVRSGPLPLRVVLPAIPTVWVFTPTTTPSHGDMVYPDNKAIGQMAVQYLVARGHGRLAVLNAWPEHPEAGLRAATFVRIAQAQGAHVETIPCERKDLKLGIAEAVTLLLSYSPPPTGVFLPIGDECVEHLYRALRDQGVRCGESMAVISCNNDRARLWALDPKLPNIDIRADEIGRVAAETLLWRMRHPAAPRRRIMIEPLLQEAPLES